jgi:hypothetical protein
VKRLPARVDTTDLVGMGPHIAHGIEISHLKSSVELPVRCENGVVVLPRGSLRS